MRTPAVTVVAVLLALVALRGTVFAGQGQPAPAFRIIVNSRNALSSVDRAFLQDAFLKKRTRWPNDAVIRPVDMVASSNVRDRSSTDVLRRSVGAVRAYWQQRIFSGSDVPPPEVDNDANVIDYVRRNEGAVGYVSGGADLNGMKELTVAP